MARSNGSSGSGTTRATARGNANGSSSGEASGNGNGEASDNGNASDSGSGNSSGTAPAGAGAVPDPPGGSGSDGARGARGTPRSRQRVPRGANTKVIVRIDHAALVRGRTAPGETCEIAGLGPVSVATVQALMADAFVAAVVTKGRDVVTVAHLGRTVNAHQRTAIEAGGLACTNIACNQTVGIEIDHREPWAEVGETLLSNQDPLCRTDHLRKTHHGWSLEPGTGRRRFLPPGRGGRVAVEVPGGSVRGREEPGP